FSVRCHCGFLSAAGFGSSAHAPRPARTHHNPTASAHRRDMGDPPPGDFLAASVHAPAPGGTPEVGRPCDSSRVHAARIKRQTGRSGGGVHPSRPGVCFLPPGASEKGGQGPYGARRPMIVNVTGGGAMCAAACCATIAPTCCATD